MATSISKKIPYPTVTANDIRDKMIEYTLYSVYKNAKNNGNEKMQKHVEKSFLKFYGYPLNKTFNPNPICLHGVSGVGKTSLTIETGKNVAEILEMNFVNDPKFPFEPGENDFVCTAIDLAGEVSNMMLAGLPVEGVFNDEKTKYMSKLISYQFAALKKAGAGMVILDDFGSASPGVQAACLSLINIGRYQTLDIGHTMRVLATNLGSIDNNFISNLKSASITRMENYNVIFPVEQFINLMQKTYNDNMSDASIISFLRANPEDFITDTTGNAGKPVNGIQPPINSPRTWQYLIETIRNEIYKNQYGGVPINFLNINTTAQSLIEISTATKFAAHFMNVMQEVDGLARKLILEGKKDDKQIAARFGGGTSAEQQRFANQLMAQCSAYASSAISTSLADKKEDAPKEDVPQSKSSSFSKLTNAVAKVIPPVAAKEPDMVTYIGRFIDVALKLPDEIFMVGLSDLRERLIINNPQLRMDDASKSTNQNNHNTMFKDEVALQITNAIIDQFKRNGVKDKDLMFDTIKILSGADQFSTSLESDDDACQSTVRHKG